MFTFEIEQRNQVMDREGRFGFGMRVKNGIIHLFCFDDNKTIYQLKSEEKEAFLKEGIIEVEINYIRSPMIKETVKQIVLFHPKEIFNLRTLKSYRTSPRTLGIKLKSNIINLKPKNDK